MVGHRFKPEKAEKLLDPKRKELIPPDKILEILSLNKEDVVADLGAGNGYLTIPLAKETNETVYAIDIEIKMLELLKERAEKENLMNIQYIESNLESIRLEGNVVDKAVVAFVMHEIPNMEKALSEFKRILKSQGKLLILDWEAIESEVGPPLHERISSNEMASFLQRKGFNPKVELLNPSVYAIIMKKE